MADERDIPKIRKYSRLNLTNISECYWYSSVVAKDDRGTIYSIWDNTLPNLPTKFAEMKQSISKKGVIRGFHGDEVTGKLMWVNRGHAELYVVDCRRSSATYLNVFHIKLNHQSKKMIYIPPGCLNAHYVHSKLCIMNYLTTQVYQGAAEQVTVKWNDPMLKINWPIKDPILSDRDKKGSKLLDVKFR